MRQFATTTDLENWYQQGPGGTPDAPAGYLLRLASADIARLTRMAVYEVDSEGMPTDTAQRTAFREATCAQAQYLDDTGDPEGVSAAGFKSLSLGSFSGTKADDADSIPRYGSLAVQILIDAGLISNAPVVY